MSAQTDPVFAILRIAIKSAMFQTIFQLQNNKKTICIT